MISQSWNVKGNNFFQELHAPIATSELCRESPEKLRLPCAHCKVKILVCEKIIEVISISSVFIYIYKKHISIDKEIVKKFDISNTRFSVDKKQTWLLAEKNMHACNVIADIAVPLKNHKVFFELRLLNQWTKNCFHSRIQICGEIKRHCRKRVYV